MESAKEFADFIKSTDVQILHIPPPNDRRGNPCMDLRINPHDKWERNVFLNPKEANEFCGICEYGPEQIIRCYREYDELLNSLSFSRMCSDCDHCICRGHQKWIHWYDQYDKSIWKPNFFARWVKAKEYLDESDSPNWFVYFISDGEFIKIGKSNNPKKRMSELQVGNARDLHLLFQIPTVSEKAAFEAEKMLHRVYRDYSANGEWFKIHGKLAISSWQSCYGSCN